MRCRTLLLLAVLFSSAALAFGQLDTDSVTITASQSIYAAPDQVVFRISVTSGLSAGLDDVLKPLATLGITAANLTGITTIYSQIGLASQTALQWSFTLTAPFASLAATVIALTALEQTIQQNNSGLLLSFWIAGSQVSAASQSAEQCPVASLFAAAWDQAQKVAATAGLKAGAVLALSNTSQPVAYAVGDFAVSRLGTFSSFLIGPSPALTCSLTAKFSLSN